MLSTSNVSGGDYYLNTSNYSLSKDELLQFRELYGNLLPDLNLTEKFNKDDFTNLLEGKIILKQKNDTNIDDDQSNTSIIELGRRKDGEIDHDKGRDLTFSAPKSVSLQHNMEGGDKRIKNALFNATKETLAYIEKNFTFTRVKDKSGKIELQKTDNLASSLFYENLNRDLEFDDHIHCVIFNMTKRADGKFRSVEFKKIIENKMHFGKIFRLNLANQIQKLGYEIDITNEKYNFFEIKGFSKDLIKEFSSRTETINQKALELNPNPNAKTKELANLLTRNNKEETLSISNIKDVISKRVRNLFIKLGITKDKIIEDIKLLTKEAKNGKLSSNSSMNAKKAIGFAVEHLSENRSYFLNKDVIEHAVGYVSANRLITDIGHLETEITRLVKKDFLISTDRGNISDEMYGTRDSLEKEKAIINICYEGKNKINSIASKATIENYFQDTKLTKGQLEAVKLILNSKDRINVIQGYAGTGKTYALSKVKEYLDHINQENKNQDHPYKLIGLAPSGSAAKELESVLGKGNGNTLQGFVKKYSGYTKGRGTIEGIEKEREQYKNHTLLVDESSMIGSNMMHDLMVIGKTIDLKMIFLGDKSQLLSIESGVPFYQIQKEDIPIAKMTDIVRQKDKIGKAISYTAYAKDFSKFFQKVGTNLFDCHENVKLLGIEPNEKTGKYYITNDHTAAAATKLYASFDESKRQETIILTPSNSTRNLTNKYIREILEKREILSNDPDKEINQKILVNANLTIAQRGNYYFYNSKDGIILFNKAVKRFNINKNEYFKVKDVNSSNKTLLLESLNSKDKTIIFDPAKSNSLRDNIECYHIEDRNFKEGEKILFTRKIERSNQISQNKYDIDTIINSTIATITKIDNKSKDVELSMINHDTNKEEITHINLNNPEHQHILKHSDYAYCTTNYKAQGKTAKNSIIIMESFFKHLTDKRNLLVSATRQTDNIYMITDNKTEVINTIVRNLDDKQIEETGLINAKIDNKELLSKQIELKEKLFQYSGGRTNYKKYQLAIKNNQNFNQHYNQERDKINTKLLNNEIIDPKLTTSDNIKNYHTITDIIKEESKKEEFVSLDSKITKKLEEKNKHQERIQKREPQKKESQKKPYRQINSSQDNKLSPQEKRQYVLDNLPDNEVKKHFTDFIHNNFSDSELSKMDNAMDNAFNNQGHNYRFGQKNSCSIVWHGKAGHIKDFRTDNTEKWGIGNIILTDTEKSLYGLNDNNQSKEAIQEIKNNFKTREQRNEERIKEQEQQKLQNKINYNNKAKEAEKLFNYHKNQKTNQDPKLKEEKLKNHPYLKDKNLNNSKKILNHSDIVLTKDNRILIAVKDKDNNIRSIQSIDEKGNKRFLKGAEKQGNFLLIKGSKDNEKNIYLTEGVATAISINQATNCPTISCFDAGNIEKTLKELTTKFKDKNFIIAADNDRFKLNKTSNKIEEKLQNTGKEKAINTAKKYNAKVILPKFNNSNNKDHIKLLTDFNDLHKHYGIDHVKEQLHNKENYLHLEHTHNIKHIEITK